MTQTLDPTHTAPRRQQSAAAEPDGDQTASGLAELIVKLEHRLYQGLNFVESDPGQEVTILTAIKIKAHPDTSQPIVTYKTKLISADAAAKDAGTLTNGQLKLPHFALAGLDYESRHDWQPTD